MIGQNKYRTMCAQQGKTNVIDDHAFHPLARKKKT